MLRSAGLLPGTVQELFSFHSELRHKQLLSAALSVTAELGPGVSQPPGTERDLPILPAAEAGARLTPRSVFSAAFLQLLVSSLNFTVPFFHSFFFCLSSQHLLAASLSVRSLPSCGHSLSPLLCLFAACAPLAEPPASSSLLSIAPLVPGWCKWGADTTCHGGMRPCPPQEAPVFPG